jgi:phage FluMu protein Com
MTTGTFSLSPRGIPTSISDLLKAFNRRYQAPSEARRVLVRPGNTEAMAQCPKCKVLQTIEFTQDHRLVPTRKFYQRDALIYHDCGSGTSCNLYTVNHGDGRVDVRR